MRRADYARFHAYRSQIANIMTLASSDISSPIQSFANILNIVHLFIR